MLEISNCEKRHCKYYFGILQPDGTELTEVNYCKAFLDGIPDGITYGDNKHLKPEEGQKNKIAYEKGKFEWEQDKKKSLGITSLIKL